MRTATKRSRRVFGFCADYLLDDRPSILMGYLVGIPLRIFKVLNTRKHMERIFACSTTPFPSARRSMTVQPVAACVKNPDFRIALHLVRDGVHQEVPTPVNWDSIKLLIGNMDEEDKLRIRPTLTTSADVQAPATCVVKTSTPSASGVRSSTSPAPGLWADHPWTRRGPSWPRRWPRMQPSCGSCSIRRGQRMESSLRRCLPPRRSIETQWRRRPPCGAAGRADPLPKP